jgi:hypothetical protein
LAQRFGSGGPDQKRHIAARLQQPAAKIAPDRSRSNDKNTHPPLISYDADGAQARRAAQGDHASIRSRRRGLDVETFARLTFQRAALVACQALRDDRVMLGAAATRRFSSALAGGWPVSSEKARLNCQGLRCATFASSATVRGCVRWLLA